MKIYFLGLPTLLTERLSLRPFKISDALRVQLLAGHPLVAAMTATIPHPYLDGVAEGWISRHDDWYRNGHSATFAIVLRDQNEIIGCIDIGMPKVDCKAEVGYWIGVDFWNRGYCSEATFAVLKFGFEKLNLNKVTSRHISTNPGSGRVMVKVGMKKEGTLRQEIFKNGKFQDLEVYGVLRSEFSA